MFETLFNYLIPPIPSKFCIEKLPNDVLVFEMQARTVTCSWFHQCLIPCCHLSI